MSLCIPGAERRTILRSSVYERKRVVQLQLPSELNEIRLLIFLNIYSKISKSNDWDYFEKFEQQFIWHFTSFQEPNDGQYCDQVCTNANGSYNCSCQVGYELQREDGRTCIALNSPGLITNYVDWHFSCHKFWFWEIMKLTDHTYFGLQQFVKFWI